MNTESKKKKRDSDMQNNADCVNRTIKYTSKIVCSSKSMHMQIHSHAPAIFVNVPLLQLDNSKKMGFSSSGVFFSSRSFSSSM